MKNFPMFLRMDGRRVVLCGGGEEVARKARLILKTEARITILADRLASRAGHYAGPALLDSQLDTLEPPGDVLRLDGTSEVHTLIETIRNDLGV